MLRTRKTNKGKSTQLTPLSKLYQKFSGFTISTFPFMPSAGKYNITISEEKQFLWFRVAKVGTRTIFQILEQGRINLTAEHPMNCHYPVDRYKHFFKFAFVRNPWDRLISCWYNKVIESNHFQFDPNMHANMQKLSNFIAFVEQQDLKTCDAHLRLQSSLVDLNNVDFLGRFENFDSDLAKVFERIGVELQEIPKYNQSAISKGFYKDHYNESLKEKVAQLYEKDIRLFSYSY